MTLPSDPKNNNADDPLGGLDPLAWLESLAKRQGANPDELTTSANLDVPMPPADTVIDEPGYTPGYDAGKSAAPALPQPPAPVEPPVAAQPPPTPAPEPVQPPVAAQLPTPEPVPVEPTSTPEPAPVMDASDPFGGLDPMAWLESLAKRQGANPEELTTAADLNVPLPPADTVIDEPGYTPGYDVRKAETPAAATPPAPVPPPVQAPAVAQPPVPEPAAVEVPAAPSPAPEPAQAPVAAQPPPPPPVQAPLPVVQPEAPVPATPEPVPAMDNADPFAASDPMAWLESLAKRQGANPEELITAADLNVPMPPADTVVDEPGYTDYSPFAGPPVTAEPSEAPTMSPAEAEALLGITANAPEPNPLNEMDPLAWLESLAAPQAASATDFSIFASPSPETSQTMEAASALSWLEQLAREAQTLPAEQSTATTPPGEVPAEEAAWVDTTPRPVEEAGGMSDDLAEVQKWLAAQADSLAQVHELGEVPVGEEDVPPAVAGELPEWLRDQMPAEPTPGTSLPKEAALVDELAEPPIPADLPAWLLEESGLATEDNLSLALAGQSTEAGLPAEAHPAGLETGPSDISPAELEALFTPGAGEAPDPWIEAFEFEENRKKAGDESIPEWYTEALQQYGETTGQVEAPVMAQPDVLPPGDVPSWLTILESESQTTFTPAPEAPPTPLAAEAAAIPGDIPAWLLGAMPSDFPSSGPSTPSIGLDTLDLAELPEWLRPAAEAEAPGTPLPSVPEPAPEPAAALPVTPPTPAPPVAVPVETPAPVMAAPPTPTPPPQPVTPPVLAPSPVEHIQRLQQARTLVAQQQYKDSLPHYQSLIDAEAHLDDVIGDMQQVVTAQPADPRPRRLLGDAHLRQGNLQAALDAYRGALDTL